MARKPETTFYESVHRHLPPVTELWREKMANPYRGGTADTWYSGRRIGRCKSHDLWVEWKFIDLPVRDSTVINLVDGKKPPISELQQSWLRDRHLEGRNVWVIVGCAEGGVVFTDMEWERPLLKSEFAARLLKRPALAHAIEAFVHP